MDLPITKAKPRIRLERAQGHRCTGCVLQYKPCSDKPLNCVQEGKFFVIKLVQEGVSAST